MDSTTLRIIGPSNGGVNKHLYMLRVWVLKIATGLRGQDSFRMCPSSHTMEAKRLAARCWISSAANSWFSSALRKDDGGLEVYDSNICLGSWGVKSWGISIQLPCVTIIG